MQKSDAQIDFRSDKITMLGEQMDVVISDSGHYCSPLARMPSANDKHTARVLFSYNFDDDFHSNYKKVVKLHRQFCHPKADALYNLIKSSGTTSSDIDKICKDVSNKCDTCKRYHTKPLRPVVAFPSASTFNERLAVDLNSLV